MKIFKNIQKKLKYLIRPLTFILLLCFFSSVLPINCGFKTYATQRKTLLQRISESGFEGESIEAKGFLTELSLDKRVRFNKILQDIHNCLMLPEKRKEVKYHLGRIALLAEKPRKALTYFDEYIASKPGPVLIARAKAKKASAWLSLKREGKALELYSELVLTVSPDDLPQGLLDNYLSFRFPHITSFEKFTLALYDLILSTDRRDLTISSRAMLNSYFDLDIMDSDQALHLLNDIYQRSSKRANRLKFMELQAYIYNFDLDDYKKTSLLIDKMIDKSKANNSIVKTEIAEDHALYCRILLVRGFSSAFLKTKRDYKKAEVDFDKIIEHSEKELFGFEKEFFKTLSFLFKGIISEYCFKDNLKAAREYAAVLKIYDEKIVSDQKPKDRKEEYIFDTDVTKENFSSIIKGTAALALAMIYENHFKDYDAALYFNRICLDPSYKGVFRSNASAAVKRLEKKEKGTAYYYYSLAANYYKFGNIQKAMENFRKVSKNFKNDPMAEEAWFTLARIEADDLLNTQRSLGILNEYMKRYPESIKISRAMFKKAEIYEYLAEYILALEEYRKISEKFKGAVRFQSLEREAAILSKKMNNSKEAYKIYEKIFFENPYGRAGDNARLQMALLKIEKLKDVNGGKIILEQIVASTNSIFKSEAIERLEEMALNKIEKIKEKAEKDKEPKEKDKTPKEKDKAPKEKDKAPKEKDKAPKEKDKAPKEKDKAPKEKDKTLKKKDKDSKNNKKYESKDDTVSENLVDKKSDESIVDKKTDLLKELFEIGQEVDPDLRDLRIRDFLKKSKKDHIDSIEYAALVLESISILSEVKLKKDYLFELADLYKNKIKDIPAWEECLQIIIMTSSEPEIVIDAMVQLGKNKLSTPDYNSAEPFFMKILDTFGNFSTTAEAALLMGDLRYKYQNRYDDALVFYERALKISNVFEISIKALRGMAAIYAEQSGFTGEKKQSAFDEQREYFIKSEQSVLSAVISAFPKKNQSALAWYRSGLISIKFGDFHAAQEFFTTLCTEFSDTFWSQLATIEIEKIKDIQRIAKFNEFVIRFPTSNKLEMIYYNLGVSQLRCSMLAEAARTFNAQLFMYPEGKYYKPIKKLLNRMSAFKEELEIRKELLKWKNHDIRRKLFKNLIETLISTEQYSLAEYYLEYVLYRYPAWKNSFTGLQASVFNKAEYKVINDFITNRPDSLEAAAFEFELAFYHKNKRKDYIKATSILENIYRKNKQNTLGEKALGELSEIYEKNIKDYKKAAEWLTLYTEILEGPQKVMSLRKLTQLFDGRLKDSQKAAEVKGQLLDFLSDEEKETEIKDLEVRKFTEEIKRVRKRLFDFAGTGVARQELYNLASKLDKRELYDLAAVQYEDYAKLFKSAENLPDVFLRLGEIYVEPLKKTKKAIKWFEEYLKAKKDISDRDSISLKIAELRKESGDLKGAVKHLDLWLKKYSDSTEYKTAETMLVEFKELAEKKKTDGSDDEEFKRKDRYDGIEASDLEIEVEEYSSSLTDNEVKILKEISEEQKKVLADPGDSEAPVKLQKIADSYGKDLGDYEKQVLYYKKIARFYIDYAVSKDLDLKLAEIAEERANDYEEAVAYYVQYYDREPMGDKGAYVCFKIAQLNQFKLEGFEDAREYYDKLFESYPQCEWEDDALYSAALNYSDNLRDYEQAVEYYRQLVERYYDSEFADDSQYRIGMIYEKNLYDFAAAKDAYQKVLDNYSSSALYSEAQNGIYRMEEYIQQGY